MLNLSEVVKHSPNIFFIRKCQYCLSPEIYSSENIRDFQDEDFLEFPLYKSFLFDNRAYIIFKNIGLDKLEDHFFNLHDSSGKRVAYWGDNKDLLYSTLTSFDEVKASQGLKEKDWVYEILAEYFISDNFLSIINVDKYPCSRINKKDSVFDKINNLRPKPVMQPVF